MLPLSCGVGPAAADVDPPDNGWEVADAIEPTPMPIVIVDGGPALVKSMVIWNPSEVTVNGCESLEPTCTVPEKFSVTSGEDGARGNEEDEGVSPLEQPTATSATATATHARVYFTSASF